MGANKSPGNDGLSKEFYICFFKEIHIYRIQALNHSFSNEQLSNSHRQAMTTLIEKNSKIKGTLKIGDQSLSSALMSKEPQKPFKAIAMRIKKVIPKLVHCDQTA